VGRKGARGRGLGVRGREEVRRWEGGKVGRKGARGRGLGVRGREEVRRWEGEKVRKGRKEIFSRE